MTIEDAATHGSPFDVLGRAIDGVFEVMAPREVSLDYFIAAWSRPLPTRDYNDSRSAFAREIVGDANIGDIVLTDASALADVQGDDYRAQVEWGIVEPRELRAILQRPQRGRLSQNRPALLGNPVTLSTVKTTSAFAETFVQMLAVDDVTSSAEVAATGTYADRIGRIIAETVTKRFTDEETPE